jgi:hypothetical protein
MFDQKLFKKCCMEIHVKIDICTFYLYKIHLGLNKIKCKNKNKKMYIHYLSFHEENFIKGTK